jgi:hypothetical protein
VVVFLATYGHVHAQSYIVQHRQTPSVFQANYNALVPQGYRPISITAHEAVFWGPMFEVTWVKDGFTSWSSNVGATWDEYQAYFEAHTELGYRPLCVEAYGDYPNEKYVSIWTADRLSLPWEARHRMTLFDLLASAGYRPYWISSSGTGLAQMFSALWVNDGKEQCIILNSTPGGFDDNVQDDRAGGCRLVSATTYNNILLPLFGGVLSFSEQPPWESFYNQTLTQLNATTSQYLSLGFRPTFVSAYETSAGTRYFSAWEEIPEPKIWTVTGPDAPELAGFDAAMKKFMKDRHIPNAGLTVTKDSRLVLARGYTYGPAGWPISQPDSRFRLASLSKTLTAVGVMKLIQAGEIDIDHRSIRSSTPADGSTWNRPSDRAPTPAALGRTQTSAATDVQRF